MPTGELTLDIKKFEDAWTQAIEDIAKLEPEVKAANAQLKLMERAFRGAGDGAKVSAKQLDTQKRVVKELERELKQSKSELKAFDDQLGKQNKTGDGVFKTLGKLRTQWGLLFSGVAVGAIISAGKALLDFAVDVKDTSTEAGILPSKLLKIQAALGNKLNAEDTSKALITLNGLLQAARDGSVEAQQKLDIFGASAEDTADSALTKLAQYIEQTGDKTVTLNTVINTLGDDLGRRFIPAADGMSKALDNAAKSADAAKDAMVDMAAEGSHALAHAGRAVMDWGLSWVGKTVSMVKNVKAGNWKAAGSDYLYSLTAGAVDIKTAAPPSAGTGGGTSGGKPGGQGAAQGGQGGGGATPGGGKPAAAAVRSPKEQLRSEITLLDARANKDRSYDAAKRESLASIAAIDAQMNVASNKASALKMAQLKAQRREAVLNLIVLGEGYRDEITQLTYETQIMDAQLRGLTGVAEQVQIIAKYDAEISKQRRLQNNEAVSQLQKQKALALIEARAKEHDVTAQEKNQTRHETAIKFNKAREQEAHEADLRRRARGETGLVTHGLDEKTDPSGSHESGVSTRGLSGGAYGGEIDEQLAKDKAAALAARTEAADKATAAALAQKQGVAMDAVIAIAREITGGKK